jgi:hypothetical protein
MVDDIVAQTLDTLPFATVIGIAGRLLAMTWRRYFQIEFSKSDLGLTAGLTVGLFIFLRQFHISLGMAWMLAGFPFLGKFLFKLLFKKLHLDAE